LRADDAARVGAEPASPGLELGGGSARGRRGIEVARGRVGRTTGAPDEVVGVSVAAVDREAGDVQSRLPADGGDAVEELRAALRILRTP
jgi:hypothetical protein